MNEIYDDPPVALKPDDAPALARVETVQPRAVRSQVVALDGRVLAHIDAVEGLYDYLPLGGDGRRLLRSLHGALEVSHTLAQGLLRSVERGG